MGKHSAMGSKAKKEAKIAEKEKEEDAKRKALVGGQNTIEKQLLPKLTFGKLFTSGLSRQKTVGRKVDVKGRPDIGGKKQKHIEEEEKAASATPRVFGRNSDLKRSNTKDSWDFMEDIKQRSMDFLMIVKTETGLGANGGNGGCISNSSKANSGKSINSNSTINNDSSNSSDIYSNNNNNNGNGNGNSNNNSNSNSNSSNENNNDGGDKANEEKFEELLQSVGGKGDGAQQLEAERLLVRLENQIKRQSRAAGGWKKGISEEYEGEIMESKDKLDRISEGMEQGIESRYEKEEVGEREYGGGKGKEKEPDHRDIQKMGQKLKKVGSGDEVRNLESSEKEKEEAKDVCKEEDRGEGIEEEGKYEREKNTQTQTQTKKSAGELLGLNKEGFTRNNDDGEEEEQQQGQSTVTEHKDEGEQEVEGEASSNKDERMRSGSDGTVDGPIPIPKRIATLSPSLLSLPQQGERKQEKKEATGQSKRAQDMASKKTPAAMRMHAARELVITEKNFMDNLFIIKKVWMEPVFASANTSKPIIPYQSARVIFFGINELHAHARKFYKDLDKAVMACEHPKYTGDVAADRLSVGGLFQGPGRCWQDFVAYVQNYGSAMEHLRKLEEYKPYLRYEEECMSQKRTSRQSLKDLLMLPVQRVMRYTLLLKNILRHTPATHIDHIEQCRAVKFVTALAAVVNEVRRRQEDAQSATLVFRSIDDCPQIPARVPRRVVCESFGYDLLSKSDIRLVLFNDVLVVARTTTSSTSYALSSKSSISMSIGINSNSTTHSTTHSHSHSYTKSNWSFYGYAPLDQVEIQNAGESTDTLITVLALNHYRRPAKADYRRSLSATNLLVTRDSPQSQSQPQLQQQQQQQNTHTHAQPALPISASASFSSSNALAAALVSSTPTNQIQSYNAASSFEKPRDSLESPKNLLGREMALKKSMSSSQTSNSPIEMTVYKVTKLTSHNPHQNPQNLLSSSGSDLFSPISIPAYPPKSACNSTTNLSNPSTMINSSLSTSPVASISPSSNSATTTPASASIASSIVASTNPFPPPLRTFSLVLQHPTSVARRFFVNALLEAEKALSSSISASHYPASNSAMMYILASNDSSSKPSTNTDVIFPIITDSNTESDYDSQPHSNSNSHSESESQPHSRPQSTRSSFISPQQSTPTPTPTPTLQSQQQSQLHHLTVPIVSNLSSASSVLSSTSSTSNINSNHNTNLGNPEHSLSRSSSYGTTNDVFIMKPYSSSLYSSPSLPQSLNNNNTKDYIRTSSTQPSSSNTISPSDFNPNSSSLYNDHQN